jgi:spore germination protein YaaH
MSRGMTRCEPVPCVSTIALTYGSKRASRWTLMLLIVLTIFTLTPPTAYAANPANASRAGSSDLTAVQQPLAAWSCRGIYHVVGRGETIYSIARRYGTTAYRIAVCNGLASYTVYAGQALLVPMAATPRRVISLSLAAPTLD